MGMFAYVEEKRDFQYFFTDEEYKEYLAEKNNNQNLQVNTKGKENNKVVLCETYDNTKDLINALKLGTGLTVVSILGYGIYKRDEIMDWVKEQAMSLIPHPHISLPSPDTMFYLKATPVGLIGTYLLLCLLGTLWRDCRADKDIDFMHLQKGGEKDVVALHKEYQKALQTKDRKKARALNLKRMDLQRELLIDATVKRVNEYGIEEREPVLFDEKTHWQKFIEIFIGEREIYTISQIDGNLTKRKKDKSDYWSTFKSRIIYTGIPLIIYLFLINN